MKQTKNYKLQLPEAADNVEVSVLDGNFEILDEEVGNLANTVGTLNPPKQTELETDIDFSDTDYISIYRAAVQALRKVPLTRVLAWIKTKLSEVFAPLTHAERHKKGGADPLSPEDIGAEATHATATATLSSSSWSGNGPYTQEVAIPGMSATRDGMVGLSPTRTEAQHLAAAACMLLATSARAGYLTITALRKAPSVDIPIAVTMLTGGTGKLLSCFPGGGAEDVVPYAAQASAPENTSILWVDTGSGGIMKYHNGTAWIPVTAAWG